MPHPAPRLAGRRCGQGLAVFPSSAFRHITAWAYVICHMSYVWRPRPPPLPPPAGASPAASDACDGRRGACGGGEVRQPGRPPPPQHCSWPSLDAMHAHLGMPGPSPPPRTQLGMGPAVIRPSTPALPRCAEHIYVGCSGELGSTAPSGRDVACAPCLPGRLPAWPPARRSLMDLVSGPLTLNPEP